METFARQLVNARKEAGMTQEQLAEAVHVARNTISNWERGERQPDVETMRQLGQVLNIDFLNHDDEQLDGADQPIETEELPYEPDEPETTSEADIAPHETPDAPAVNQMTQPARNPRSLIVTVAVIVAAVVALLSFILNKPVTEVRDDEGNVYRIADFQQVTPNDPDKAYLTINTSTETLQGDNMTLWMYTFIMREDNGIAFHIDRLENIWIKKSSAQRFVYSDNDLTLAQFDPDIAAGEKREFKGGMPLNQTNMLGVACVITGHDANGEELTFRSYIPFPQV